jgi:hypothetical protein
MDEMRMIRNFLDEAPPSADVVAEGRRRMATGASRARTRRRLWGGVTVLAAAATAVALAIGLTGGTPAVTKKEPVRPLTARQVLLTAAEKAAATPVGRYWHTHVISSEGYHIDHGDYMIFGARHEIDQWIGRSDKDGDVFRGRFGGAIPQTAADRSATCCGSLATSWSARPHRSCGPRSSACSPASLAYATWARHETPRTAAERATASLGWGPGRRGLRKAYGDKMVLDDIGM